MSCVCGFTINDLEASGGAKVSGSATVSQHPNRYSEVGSGGVVCSGLGSVLTSQVFDGYSGVFHLIEDGPDYFDSSLHNDATAEEPSIPAQTVSTLASYSQDFDGYDFITCPIDPDPAAYTVSFWFKIEGRFLQRVFFSRGMTDGNEGEGVSIAIGHQNFPTTAEPENNRLFARVQLVADDDWVSYRLRGSTNVPNGCWHHCALVFSPPSITLYLDGEVEATRSIAEDVLVPSSTSIQFGRSDTAEHFIGELQEVRFIAEAKSEDWIQTEYQSLCDVGFIEESAEESPIYS